MGTSQERSSAHPDAGIAARAEGYKMSWAHINGESIFDIREGVSTAMELAKSMGGGATMPGHPGPMRVKDKVAVRKMMQEDRTKQGAEFPPGASSGGYRYYIADESVVRKGVFCGWKRIQKEFPPGRTWEDLAGLVQGFPGLEEAVQEYFRQHPGRNSVEIYR